MIKVVDGDHRRCELACADMFEQWLAWEPGSGNRERTWHTVLSAVEYAGHKAFSQQLKAETVRVL